MPFSDWRRRAPCVMTSRAGGVAIRAWPGHARSSFGRTGSFREARTAKRSQHAGGPELGVSQDVRDPAETLREVPPRPGAEADRRVRAAEQARGVEGQVHAGQDPQGRPRAADAGREGPAPAVRRQRPAAAAGPHRGAGRGQDEAGLHPGAEDRGLPGEAPADPGLQAGPGQVHPPCARADPPAPHQVPVLGPPRGSDPLSPRPCRLTELLCCPCVRAAPADGGCEGADSPADSSQGAGAASSIAPRKGHCGLSRTPCEGHCWACRQLDRVRKQVVNIPSFIVRLDSQKHIDFSLRSPYGGGRPGRVKRKNAKKGQGGAGAGDDEEED